jgi:hypothetical protein
LTSTGGEENTHAGLSVIHPKRRQPLPITTFILCRGLNERANSKEEAVTEPSSNDQKIRDLAMKLGGLDDVLTDEERTILIGILGTASTALADVAGQSGSDTQPTDEDQEAVRAEAERMESWRLSEAFQLYFTPGHAGRFRIPPELGDVVARIIRG